MLLARSDRALPDLPAILRTRGFVVREVAAYRTIPGAWGDVVRVRALLESSDPHVAVIFHSPSAIEGLLTAIGPRLVARAAIYVAGQTTLRAARERLGVEERISLFEEEPADVTHR